MLVLDILHRLVRDHVDEEFKGGYTNLERLYIIFVWPTFTYGLIKTYIKTKK